jgi:hypothetical protein
MHGMKENIKPWNNVRLQTRKKKKIRTDFNEASNKIV